MDPTADSTRPDPATLVTAAGSESRDPAAAIHREARLRYWDHLARLDEPPAWNRAYRERLAVVYRHLIPDGRRVLELGCGAGDLLAAVRPSAGVGVDFSAEMVARARRRHAHLRFLQQDVHALDVDGPFDVVILSDLVNELWDLQGVLDRVRRVATPRTRLVLNTYSRLWDWPLAAVRRLKLARPVLEQNWLTVPDLVNMLDLAGFETLRTWPEVLWPLRTPGLAPLANRLLVRFWPFRHLGLANFLVARPRPAVVDPPAAPTVSVVVPARNEAGNIASILARTPDMGGGTELIFVEGHSRDDTFGTIERALAAQPERRATLFRQRGIGKGDAVRLGFEHASGDVLMILDADLAVPPEYLPRFYDALRAGVADFVNGVRLVYPMEAQAMRPLNLLGNKCFGAAFSWLLGQRVKDTLCGTKALWAEDYRLIAAHRGHFGDFDPFGDFDLLFGAARLGLKIVDLPIRYRQRTYGKTNIQRFRHAWLLVRMLGVAARRLKFV
jgi:SAM-dependent methyltransferase